MSGFNRIGKLFSEPIEGESTRFGSAKKKRGPTSAESKVNAQQAHDVAVEELMETGLSLVKDKITEDPRFETLFLRELEHLRNLDLDFDQLMIWAAYWKTLSTAIPLSYSAERKKGASRRTENFHPLRNEIIIAIQEMESKGLKITNDSLERFVNLKNIDATKYMVKATLTEYRKQKKNVS